MSLRFKTVLGAALSLSVLAGCQQSEPEAAKGKAAPEAIAESTATEVADKPAEPKENQLLAAMAQYEPPYPNRRDMFVQPKAGVAPRSTDNGEASVQLKGLVDVGEPRAILDIEGATTLLAVGSEQYGVKVIAIDNLNVTLERGRTRWTATLE